MTTMKIKLKLNGFPYKCRIHIADDGEKTRALSPMRWEQGQHLHHPI